MGIEQRFGVTANKCGPALSASGSCLRYEWIIAGARRAGGKKERTPSRHIQAIGSIRGQGAMGECARAGCLVLKGENVKVSLS
jgi:hypothetical protein